MSAFASADLTMPSVFSNHMVLQKGRARIYGSAAPGETLTINFDEHSQQVVSGMDGSWSTWLPTPRYGGPHELTVNGKSTLKFQDVMVGEVWVCSGQSNMEYSQAMFEAEGRHPNMGETSLQNLRLFHQPQRIATTPTAEPQGTWEVSSPQSVHDFSVVGFFYGRKLMQELGVPVGLIEASWGGTPAESWTSREALMARPELKPMVDTADAVLKDYPATQAKYQREVADWWKRARANDPGNAGYANGWAAPEFDDSSWERAEMPKNFSGLGLDMDGGVWFRTVVNVPEDAAGKDLQLHLAPIDDWDWAYFNGQQVGHTGEEAGDSWTRPRNYTVPGSLVKPGRNVIAIRVWDLFGEGGFAPAPQEMHLDLNGAQIANLATVWSYKVEKVVSIDPVVYNQRPVQPIGPDNPWFPSSLYNGMLYPFTRYTIKGAIWYQGESNADRAKQYQTLFPAMIQDWRHQWGEGNFPFYFVQLANFMARRDQPSESQWAELREAQTMTLGLPNTGMALAIDLGEPNNIHPIRKEELADRLALWALAKDYGKNVEFSGPMFKSASAEGDRMRVMFSHASGLHALGGRLAGFEIAGADKKFHWATAIVDGDGVWVWSRDVPLPKYVRYGWADNPEVNLVNGAGLPAVPFRTDGS